MDQALQTECFPDTGDFDIVNSLFELVSQAIKRLDVKDISNILGDVTTTVEKLRTERESICANLLKMPLREGKSILCSVFLGQSIPTLLPREAQRFLYSVERAGRFWRWAAITMMRSEFEILRVDKSISWPEASLASHLYFGIENSALCAIQELVFEFSFNHMSLHHDGLRLD